jgi:hypothetical protein
MRRTWSTSPSSKPRGSPGDAAMDMIQLASHIDHTVLRPDAKQVEIERACKVARELGCAGV